jgi:hypothetical protein
METNGGGTFNPPVGVEVGVGVGAAADPCAGGGVGG